MSDLGVQVDAVAQVEVVDIALEVLLDLLARGPFGVALGVGVVGEGVGASHVLGGEARVPARRRPDSADLAVLLVHRHVEPELAEHLRSAEAAEAGADDCNSPCHAPNSTNDCGAELSSRRW